MMRIRAIFKLPEIQKVCLIISLQQEDDIIEKHSEKSMQIDEYFEQSLRLIDRKEPKSTQKCILKLMSDSDFSKAVKQHKPIGLKSTNPSSDFPEYLELLAINRIKLPCSGKEEDLSVFCSVPEEDIIEVFI